MKLAKSEQEQTNINTVVEKAGEVYAEFKSFLSNYGIDDSLRSRYILILNNLLNNLVKMYAIDMPEMYVQVSNYALNVWGPLYWKFIHITSILLQHGLSEDKVPGDLFGFCTIVYNIDLILPCNICTEHYKSIKNTQVTLDILKKMSYGLIIQGCFEFHLLITHNINPTKQRFTVFDFIREYNCYPKCNLEVTKLTKMDKSKVIWQGKLHAALMMLLHKQIPQYTFLQLNNKLLYAYERLDTETLSLIQKSLSDQDPLLEKAQQYVLSFL